MSKYLHTYFLFTILLIFGCTTKEQPKHFMDSWVHTSNDFRLFKMGDSLTAWCADTMFKCSGTLAEEKTIYPEVGIDSLITQLSFKKEKLKNIRLEVFAHDSILFKEFTWLRNQLNRRFNLNKLGDRLVIWYPKSKQNIDMEIVLSMEPIGTSGRHYLSLALIEEDGIGG